MNLYPGTSEVVAVALSKTAAGGSARPGASFLSGPVAPGTIISIFGSEIGPAAGVGLQLNSSGQVGTLLGGSRVLFDGVPTPLISVQARQVNAVVPYEVAGKTRSVVQIEFQGKTSAGVTVPLTDSSPGLFTLDSSGKGQGAILNQDATPNSASNPALEGSVVVLYATGGGQTADGDGYGQVRFGAMVLQSGCHSHLVECRRTGC